ncbi:MAG: beta-N-acetylhexosaminidase [Proteobacteria bacterium]|nr:beta-N-acetylhexosaminidase [Desulfobulbaceae bacterium]MBU4153670.1 beta-N-acetylhexosaminidase [Pseudomonadota bacterium]
MIGIPGFELDDSTRALICEDGVHNFILFRRNVSDRQQLSLLCRQLRETCVRQGLPRPLIAIDQEGGQVARLPPPFTLFDEPRSLAESSDCQARLLHYAVTCAEELISVGINFNLAPVLDVCPVGKGLFMERRCLGDDPQRVAELGALVVGGLQSAGVAACAKHFPGLGSALLDPHLDLPVVDLSVERLMAHDLVPFVEAIDAGVAAVMTSHAVYSAMDGSLPGTLSRRVIHEVLRERCGYDGLIITDDMEMGAIEKFMAFPDAVVKAFLAGADLVLICHDHQKIRNALTSLGKILSDGTEERARVKDSLRRQDAILARIAG